MVPELIVLLVNQSSDKIHWQVELEAPQGNKIPVELIVETGSSVSILDSSMVGQTSLFQQQSGVQTR